VTKPTLSFDMFRHDVEVMSHNRGDWRLGQTAWNNLQAVRLDLADRIRGWPMLDPFYVDENLPTFWQWVAEHWDGE
jgi:hypothetical protein